MSEESDEKFRVRYLYESFLASMQDRDDIILRHYLESYTELLKYILHLCDFFLHI